MTSVYVDRADLAALKTLSEKSGISTASLLRQAVREYLERQRSRDGRKK